MAKLFHTFSSNMYFHRTILFFLLFQFKEIVPTRTIRLENDVTKLLDTWFAKIFTLDEEKIAKLFPTAPTATANEYELTVKRFQYNLTHRENPSERNIYFQNVTFSNIVWTQTPSIYCKFSENQMRLIFEEIYVRVKGNIIDINHTENTSFVTFKTELGMKNFTITIAGFGLGQSNNSPTNNKKTLYHMSYDNVPSTYYWSDGHRTKQEFWFHSSLPIETRRELTRELTPALPTMFIENVNLNSILNSIILDEISQLSHPDKKKFSMQPDFWENPQQFHYLIPRWRFYCFALNRIVIRSLWNLDSFTADGKLGIWTQALLIRNVEGSLTLDYLSTNETPLKMKFHIDSLYIMKKNNVCALAQAKYYNVTRGEVNTTVTLRQSEVIMNALESAIIASIAPTIEAGRICELKTPVEEIQIPNTSDWNMIKKAYKGWIPFNDDSA